ncbi:MAG: GTPase ObgE [Dehalococcoidia bacterium]
MIDRVQIYVKAGAGGNGIVSFRREKFVPFGGPDGGDGGDGGSICLVGDESTATLLSFRYRKQFSAGSGAHGKGKNMYGRMAKDLHLKVPLGTQVQRKEENGTVVPIADIVEHGQKVLVAKGGRGGRGNTHFASPTNQAPRTAENGNSGEEAWLLLDLKLIADVGIIGYPNAGKSTLLRTVSKAKPKVADYPFTTLEPILGVVELGYEGFVLADIPGLIEGAHRGVGLGLDFLRHIERTKVLIQLVDGSSQSPLSELRGVENELGMYDPALKGKSRIVAVNKIDLPEVRGRLPQLKRELKGLGVPIYFVSAATGEGVGELLEKALELVSQAKGTFSEQRQEAEFKVFRPRLLSAKRAVKGGADHE